LSLNDAFCKSFEQHPTAMLMPPDTGQTCGGAFLTRHIDVTCSFKGRSRNHDGILLWKRRWRATLAAPAPTAARVSSG